MLSSSIHPSIFLILLFLLFFFILYGLSKSREYFQNPFDEESYLRDFSKTNAVGDLNDPRFISLYTPQNSVFTSNLNRYWKKEPSSSNSDFIQDLPPPVQEVDIKLPITSRYGDHSYRKGLMDYDKLTKLIEDDSSKRDSFGSFEYKKLNPTTLQEIEYDYQVVFYFDMLNKKTWVNRWKEYNPLVKKKFDYSQIESPIEQVNILNNEFLQRCNQQQQNLLNDTQLTLFGVIPFEIFKYRIQKIYYQSNNQPLFFIEILLFRESDLYLSTFTYQGFYDEINKKSYIFKPNYVGGSPQDQYLLTNPSEKEKNYLILNKNYTNDDNEKVLELNPDNVVKQVKDYQEQYKLNNQYACFNTDPEIFINPQKSADVLVTFNHSDRNNSFMTREMCESSYDWYGRKKQVGILDTPCKKDSDCPFYLQNKNYPNEFGKCGEDGKCQLPVNMKNLGYRYFSPSKEFKPLCYNCNSSQWNISTPLEDCCDEQFDSKKYPFLKGPDYAFPIDYQQRYNHFIQQNCHIDSKQNLVCK